MSFYKNLTATLTSNVSTQTENKNILLTVSTNGFGDPPYTYTFYNSSGTALSGCSGITSNTCTYASSKIGSYKFYAIVTDAGNQKATTNNVTVIYQYPACTNNQVSGQCSGTLIFTASSTLTGNINATNITLDSGVTLTTDNYEVIATNNFLNSGTVSAGCNSTTGGASASGPYTSGGGCGSYGVYIQSNNITAGKINSVGGNTGAVSWSGGGGGGGVILLVYDNSLTAGTYNYSGGVASCSVCSNGSGGSQGTGGPGGNTTVKGGTPNGGIGQSASSLSGSFTKSQLDSWLSNGLLKYMSGAGGGGGADNSAYGCSDCNGNPGKNFTLSYGGSGGAGAGGGGGDGGDGGAGQVILYHGSP